MDAPAFSGSEDQVQVAQPLSRMLISRQFKKKRVEPNVKAILTRPGLQGLPWWINKRILFLTPWYNWPCSAGPAG
jgi:hypothetical protein